MIELMAMFIVALAGLFLLVLGCIALIRPARAQGFLLGFASTARVHFLELAIRLAVGLSFLGCWRVLEFGEVFRVVGWVLVLTTLVMLLVPWSVHRQFARWAVPKVLRYTPLIGASSIAMGLAVFAVLSSGTEA